MTVPIAIDVAARFLATLAGQDDPVVCFQCFDDSAAKRPALAWNTTSKLSIMTRKLSDSNAQKSGVFVTVNTTDGRGRKVENVTRLRALFIDCDGTRPLPTEWPLPPSIIVQRGPSHWHAYWCLVAGEDIARFTPAQEQLAIHWGTDRGVKDLPRVMRIPGFVHHKGEATAVQLVSTSDVRYSIDQVLAAHPVTEDQLPTADVPRATPPAPRPRGEARVAGDLSDEEMYRRYAASKETSKGGGRAHGRDTTAYSIACEGFGRQAIGLAISDAVIFDVVLEYARRAALPNPEQDTERIVKSARSKGSWDVHLPKGGSVHANHGAPRVDKMASAPSTAEDAFAAAAGGDKGGGTTPPVTPAAGGGDDEDKARSKRLRKEYGDLDCAVLETRWRITPTGVIPIEWDAKDKCYKERENKRVTDLPIWVDQHGIDVATGRSFWHVGWRTPKNATMGQWLPEADLKSGAALVALPDGPVAKRRCEDCAVWLTAARSAVTRPGVEVTSRVGWCGVNGGRRWVWPGVAGQGGLSYIGGELPHHGKLDEWKAGLQHLVQLTADDHWTALTVAAASAAAPFSRLMGARNPVIGLLAPSSTGKGASLTFAVSMWGDSETFTVPAASTSKGIQDKAIEFPDTPLWLDELQQLAEQHPKYAGEALYFLANGHRRITSSKGQVSVGGERRYGIGFYAAEAMVLAGQNTGVQYRVIELDGPPCPTEETAKILQAAARHTGVLAAPLAEYLAKRTAPEWCELLHGMAKKVRETYPGLKGDDPEALALIQAGCEALSAATGCTWEVERHLAWIAARIAKQRSQLQDRETVCLHQVLSVVLNQVWIEYGDKPDEGPRRRGSVSVNQVSLAWSQWDNAGHRTRLEVNQQHREIAQLFTIGGGESRVLKAWADRGWIARQGANLKCKRAEGGRVVRFTDAALLAFAGPDEPERTGTQIPPPKPVAAAAGPQESDPPF